ncbi:hypothetical protein [Corynebacterium sp. A21]|uniref:hypothetical protein n=1 Tax=Corynebacterium sp. A21 TaxID=3457318 RepID=UPI003FD429A6
MKIFRGVFDPAQEHIDMQVNKLTGSEIEMYEKHSTIDGPHELLQDVDRETLEGRYAYIWNRELEQRVMKLAWRSQNVEEVREAYMQGKSAAAGAMRVLDQVLYLHDQGRKSVKLSDLIDAFNTTEEEA